MRRAGFCFFLVLTACIAVLGEQKLFGHHKTHKAQPQDWKGANHITHHRLEEEQPRVFDFLKACFGNGRPCLVNSEDSWMNVVVERARHTSREDIPRVRLSYNNAPLPFRSNIRDAFPEFGGNFALGLERSQNLLLGQVNDEPVVAALVTQHTPCVLELLETNTGHMGKGYGSLMVLYAVAYLHDAGCQSVELTDCSEIDGFYQGVGFVPVEANSMTNGLDSAVFNDALTRKLP